MTSYSTFSASDSRETIEKVLKYSGDASDMIRRADVKREAAVFRIQSATTDYLTADDKPNDLEQAWDVMVFVEQGDSHSIKEARYNRLFEITDQLMDWSINVSPASINVDVYTITLTGTTPTVELEGYISTTLSFNSILKLQ